MAINGRNTIYYVFQQKKLDKQNENYKATYIEVSRDHRLFGNLTIKQGIDSIPTVSMSIPVDALPRVNGQVVRNYNNYRLKLFIMSGGVQKYGLTLVIDAVSIDLTKGIAAFQCSHRMAEMRNWLMPKNLAVKDMPLGYCVENVCKLGFPDDYVKDELVLKEINYLSNTSVEEGVKAYPQLAARYTNHTLQDWEAASAEQRIYIPEEMPVAIDMTKYAYNTKIEATFSSTNKLEGLAEIIDNTSNIHWYGVISNNEAFYPPTSGKYADGVKISAFTDEPDDSIVISENTVFADGTNCDLADPTLTTITMLSEPTYSQDFSSHYNRAAVFCGDVGAGVLHMTLKDLHGEREEIIEKIKKYIDEEYEPIEGDDDPQNLKSEAQELLDLLDKFPIGMYENNINLAPETEYNENGTKINNEKIYRNFEMPEVANNDNREYYVTDLEQLARDNGLIRHTVYNFSDLFPIPDLQQTVEKSDGTQDTVDLEITNRDRFIMTMRAYLRAVRYLKAQRPVETFSFNTTALPPLDLIGKRVRFMYKRQVSSMDECGDAEKDTVWFVDDFFYITERIITFDAELNEYATITVDKELRPNPNESLSWELSKEVEDDSDNNRELGDKFYNEYGTDYNPNATAGFEANEAGGRSNALSGADYSPWDEG